MSTGEHEGMRGRTPESTRAREHEDELEGWLPGARIWNRALVPPYPCWSNEAMG